MVQSRALSCLLLAAGLVLTAAEVASVGPDRAGNGPDDLYPDGTDQAELEADDSFEVSTDQGETNYDGLFQNHSYEGSDNQSWTDVGQPSQSGLDTNHLDRNPSLGQNPPVCQQCHVREAKKQTHIEMIKADILKKLGMEQAPNMTGLKLPVISASLAEVYMQAQREKDQQTQRDQEYVDDEHDDNSQPEKIWTFASRSPLAEGLGPLAKDSLRDHLLYFDISPGHHQDAPGHGDAVASRQCLQASQTESRFTSTVQLRSSRQNKKDGC
ncbi:uncharacterized protein LOC119097642 isoform X1 [Pollicipes pollicipes]|uniref:uncharacterized protein LOC119097642 isoform X1 n=1 Tax=Pollicipes pollicipes TaxID=41117 RepID=UPI001884E1EA|nr:uncharacterized protein LOC119097642 isoform X1 [Pollicipes pollicipes]